MNTVRYWFIQAGRSLRRRWALHLVTTSAMAVGLFLVGLSNLVYLNVGHLAEGWGRGVSLVAYLHEGADAPQVEKFVEFLKSRPEVASLKQISSSEAHARLRQTLGDEADETLEGLEDGFLPSSLELKLAGKSAGQNTALIALLRSSSLVAEVDELGKWESRIESFLNYVRYGTLMFSFIIVLACVYVVTSTIRLCVNARREEIILLKLVGATGNYIRMPFLLEGVLAGIMGTLGALGLLYLVYHYSLPAVEAALSLIFARLDLVFLSPAMMAIGGAAGIVIGALGGAIALWRYADV